jgi:hypothetical protein
VWCLTVITLRSWCTVTIIASGKVFRGRAAVLALGGWAAKLLGLPISVTEETVGYFEPRAGMEVDHTAAAMPVFICHFENGLVKPDLGYYGLPQVCVWGGKGNGDHDRLVELTGTRRVRLAGGDQGREGRGSPYRPGHRPG